MLEQKEPTSTTTANYHLTSPCQGVGMRGQETLTVFVLINMLSEGVSLKCWKCIAHDCAYDPEENYKASKVRCDEGQQCMKVRYRMYDNITYYDSVIRTCTAGPCQMTSQHEFQQCIATPKLYMISGCSLRSCCADRDLCNAAARREPDSITLTLCLMLLVVVSTMSKVTRCILE